MRQQAITWANVDPDLCRYVVSLSQNELIGIIALVLQGIHHNIIVFCNISWIRTEYENKIKYIQFWCTLNYFYIIHKHHDNNDVVIHWMKYILATRTTDTSVIGTEFFSVENKWDGNWNKMKMIPIISFSIHAIGVSYTIVSIFKFIFTLIYLMAIISDINMWLWQWLKFMYCQ